MLSDVIIANSGENCESSNCFRKKGIHILKWLNKLAITLMDFDLGTFNRRLTWKQRKTYGLKKLCLPPNNDYIEKNNSLQ